MERLTDKQLEAAARFYCRERGLDPEETLIHDVEGSGMMHYAPRWWLIAERFKEADRVRVALEYGSTTPKE